MGLWGMDTLDQTAFLVVLARLRRYSFWNVLGGKSAVVEVRLFCAKGNA